MIYIYVYTNNKESLSRLRRMCVVYKMLRNNGLDVQMLTNDFRASSVARDLGVPSCVNIQTIVDIDSVAGYGDIVIIDSPEDAGSRMQRYRDYFSKVICISRDENRDGCTHCLDIDPLVDESYMTSKMQKSARALLFFGDADSKKQLLSKYSALGGMGVELLLGEYFYPSYDEQLLDIFPIMHESEEYMDMICSSSTIVSPLMQTIYESMASGAKCVYIDDGNTRLCDERFLQDMNIPIIDINSIDKSNDIIYMKIENTKFDFDKHFHKIEEKIIKIIRM